MGLFKKSTRNNRFLNLSIPHQWITCSVVFGRKRSSLGRFWMIENSRFEQEIHFRRPVGRECWVIFFFLIGIITTYQLFLRENYKRGFKKCVVLALSIIQDQRHYWPLFHVLRELLTYEKCKIEYSSRVCKFFQLSLIHFFLILSKVFNPYDSRVPKGGQGDWKN